MPRTRSSSCHPRLQRRGQTYYIYYTSQGKTCKLSTKTTDQRSAELALAEFIAVYNTRKTVSVVPTISELLDAYLQYKENTNGIKNVRLTVNTLRSFFGKYTADLLSDDLYECYRTERNVNRTTTNRDLAILNACLNYAVEQGYIEKFKRAKMKPSNPPRDYWITKEEAKRLLDEADHSAPHLKVFIALALNTLARRSAILGLTWDRVNFETGLIDLVDPEMTQSNKRRSVIPINSTLRPILLEARELAITDYVIEFKGHAPVINIGKSFRLCAKRAGLPKVSPHILRHSGATWLAMAGIPMYEIARYLGHTDIKTTYSIYAKYSPDYLKNAAAVLG